MPIRIEHGPIALAMRLARQAGSGEAQSEKWRRDVALLELAQRQQQMEADVTSRSRAFALQSALAGRMAKTLTQRGGRPAAPAMDQVLERMKFKSAREAQEREGMMESLGQMVEEGTLSPEQGKIASFGAAIGNEAIINAALKPSLPAAPGTISQKEAIPYAVRKDVELVQSVSEEHRKNLYSRMKLYRAEVEKGKFDHETMEDYQTRLQAYRQQLAEIPAEIQESLMGEKAEVRRLLSQAPATTGAVQTRPDQPSGGTVEPPEETPAALPQVPTDKRKWVAGQRYLTPDGIEVRWTGSVWQRRT